MAEFANDSIKGVKLLIEQIQILKKELKELAVNAGKSVESFKVDQANIKEIQKLSKAQETLLATQKELTKLEKQEVQLKAKLVTLQSDETDQIQELRVQTQELNKKKKEEAKERLGLIGAYQKQSKRLNELRKDYKNIIVAEGKSTKETKKLLKEIQKLDRELKEVDESAGQFQRNVGNYPETLSKATKQLAKFAAGAVAVGASLKSIQGSLEASEEGSEDLRVATSKLDAAMQIGKNTLASFALDVWDFGKAVVNGEKSITEIGDSFNRTSKATENIGEKLNNTLKAAEEGTKMLIELEKVSRGLRLEVERLTGEIDKQNAIAGDSTKGFDSIAEASEKALKAERERAAILLSLANEELKIIEKQIEARGENSNNLDLLNAKAEKQIEILGLKNDLSVAEIELNKELNLNERDRFEKALDFALDLFDTQKTLNERSIADETKTFEERINILKRTNQLSDEAFAEQTRLAEKQVGKRLKLNELVELDDQKVIFARITALTQDEIVQQRLLDIIRDRKTAIQDLKDAEIELAQAIKDRGKEETEAAIALQTFRMERDAEAAENLEERVEREIELAEFKAQALLSNEELLADERKLIEEQLEQELIDIKKRAEEEKAKIDDEARQEQIEKAQEAFSAVTSAFQDELSKQNEAQLESLNKEAEDREASVERQTQLAEQGLDNQLAFEQQKLDEANLRKLEAEKEARQKEEALQLATILGEAYIARLKEGEGTGQALANATADTFVYRGIAKALVAGFAYDGTEDTGEGHGLDEKNGKLWMLHPHERVMSKSQMKR